MRRALALNIVFYMKVHAILICLACQSVTAQHISTPSIQWQQTIGGTNADMPFRVVETKSGYAVAGSSASGPSGNKKSPLFDTNRIFDATSFFTPPGDFWLTHLDKKGRVQWDRSYGFENAERLTQFQILPDGGFLLGGYSITGFPKNPFNPNAEERGGYLVRTDSTGTVLWDTLFTEPEMNYLYGLVPIPRGGTLVLGWQGMVSLDAQGHRINFQRLSNQLGASMGAALSTPDSGRLLAINIFRRRGGMNDNTLAEYSDIRLVRSNPSGAVLWERDFGGDLTDQASRVYPMQDGGFLIVGTSTSPPSGNKSSALYDPPNTDPFLASFFGDIWLIKIDADGNKIWDQSLGTEHWDMLTEALPTADGGVSVCWSSYSMADGMFIGSHVTRVASSGAEVWHRHFDSNTHVTGVMDAPSGGLLVAAYAWEGANNLMSHAGYGSYDGWLLRVDGNGERLWDLTLGGTGSDGINTISRTSDNGFILGLASMSGPSGNKTSASYGDNDYWVVKLSPEFSIDLDRDGVPDDQDECPNTLAGAIVNVSGCSIGQLVPCDGPWKNHGYYVSAVARACTQFRKAGHITYRESLRIFLQAAKSDCGKRPRGKPIPRKH